MADTAAQAPLAALVVGVTEAYAAGPGLAETWPRARLASEVARLAERMRPRWVVWSAESALTEVVRARVDVARTWDLAEAHRLINGGWLATPGHVWAACHDLPESDVPFPRRPHLAGFELDLFETAVHDAPGDGGPIGAALLDATGHLRADALDGWATSTDRLRQLAAAALECQQLQERSITALAGADSAGMVRTVWSESAAAVLCLELERDGLPVDRLAAEDLIGAAAGPRPVDDAHAARIRASRDEKVLRHARGHDRSDLRNPAQVRSLLQSVGVTVPNTQAHVLEPYRVTHALVDALLTWRKDERISTTYGYRWLDDHVGPDDRLRGAWTASDGAAGRMTAQNGLHNLPAQLRPAIRATPGHVFVRADLGQVEPRVLAVVSGDGAFAEATRSDDLYAPVAAKLGVDRPRAKVAVLAAMYGQRSGAAGEALKDLEHAYPVAMALLDRAYSTGVARGPLRTYGGRLIRFGSPTPEDEDAHSRARGRELPATERQQVSAGARDLSAEDSARGRYARNAVIQGSAAELFKAWAATVRHAVGPLGGQIVLCLHDELLVHVPEEHAEQAASAVTRSLDAAARIWAGTDQVRFVAETSVIRRWSEAKG